MNSCRAIVISILLCLTICHSANAGDWRVVGNGGGGIVTQNGTPALSERYKRLSWINLDNDLFMALWSVTEVVQNLNIPPGPKHQLLQALDNKTYYLIPKEEAQNPDFAEAKFIYGGLWKRPIDEISVFALTLVETDETLFMPEFFLLTLNEQLSILLHEALWTIKPDLEYGNMITIESAFYNYLESGTHHLGSMVEQRLYSALAKYIFGKSFLVQSIFIMSKKKSLKEILGPELMHCAYHSLHGCSYVDGGHTPLAKALKENPYIKISINGFDVNTPKLSMAKFDLRNIFNFQSWNNVATKPNANIPFFHRTHTCVKLPRDSKLNTEIYLVIFDSSAAFDHLPSELCSDLNQ